MNHVADDKHENRNWLTQNHSNFLLPYQNAKFCLQPWGDWATRKAFYDAIAVGCINVIFSYDGWDATDTWFDAISLVTVRIPLDAAAAKKTLSTLRAIPEKEVLQLHENVLKIRHHFHYGLVGSDDDALSRVVAGAKGIF
jgi:hypothetical protein